MPAQLFFLFYSKFHVSMCGCQMEICVCVMRDFALFFLVGWFVCHFVGCCGCFSLFNPISKQNEIHPIYSQSRASSHAHYTMHSRLSAAFLYKLYDVFFYSAQIRHNSLIQFLAPLLLLSSFIFYAFTVLVRSSHDCPHEQTHSHK